MPDIWLDRKDRSKKVVAALDSSQEAVIDVSVHCDSVQRVIQAADCDSFQHPYRGPTYIPEKVSVTITFRARKMQLSMNAAMLALG